MSWLGRIAAGLPAPLRRSLKQVPGASRLRDRLYGTPQGEAYPSGALRPVVYLPTWVKWDVMKQRPQYLLEALARAGHDIYFVDPTHVGDDIVSGPIRITASLDNTPGSDVIVYTHFAPTRTMLDRYRDPVVVYDILDDLTIYEPDEVGFPPERTVRFHHGPLIGAASVVIASNPVLVERHRGERADIMLIENGVDPDLFDPQGRHVEFGDQPVIGYHGAIRSWVDFDLLEAVVDQRPGYKFVFVGPVLKGVEGEASRLFGHPNVVHIGEQPPEGVAAHVRSFTVGTVPFVVNVTTQGVTPMKLNEYLASGVPVVATPLPALLDHPLALVGDSPDRWVDLLDEAVGYSESQRDQMRAEGVRSGWDGRIGPLLERLDQTSQRRIP